MATTDRVAGKTASKCGGSSGRGYVEIDATAPEIGAIDSPLLGDPALLIGRR